MSGTGPDLSFRPPPLTTGAEISAYVVAHVIRIGAAFAVGPFYSVALYQWAMRSGGQTGIILVSLGQSVLWAALGLALFLVLRPAFDGVPPAFRDDGRGGTRFTAGFEIGAYVLAQSLGLAANLILFSSIVPQLLARFGPLDRTLLTAISIGIGVVVTAVVFVVFVQLRQGFAGPGRPAATGR